MRSAHDADYDEDRWRSVQLTKEAIRARGRLILLTMLLAAPFVALCGIGGWMVGLASHEVTGICCYNAMLSCLFFFDTLRNAAHSCYDEAQEAGLVTCRNGIPVVDPSYHHHHLAALSFAIGGRPCN